MKRKPSQRDVVCKGDGLQAKYYILGDVAFTDVFIYKVDVY